MRELRHRRALRVDADIIPAQRDSRALAESLGFSRFEVTRIATAVSEIGRNAIVHGGGGEVAWYVDDEPPARLVVEVRDRGPGFHNYATVLAGTYRSSSGMGLGVLGARRLMDDLAVELDGGTIVRLFKRLPRSGRAAKASSWQPAPSPPVRPPDVAEELRRCERELIEREDLIAQLREELEDTNRGVMALYAELEERAEYERRSKELKARLVSEMGHELRTPLYSLVTISGFLREQTDGPLNEEQARQARILHETAVSLSDYIDDLLDLARADAGRAEVKSSRFRLSKLLATLRHLMQPWATDEAVSLAIEEPRADVSCETDEGKLSQILRNLVSNALKFTEQGEVRVLTAWDEANDDLVLEVRDTGIGIAPSDHAFVFQEYGQVDSPRQRRYKGSGLGLPLTRRLVHLLGGRIELESEEGQGARFRVVVPRVYRGEILASFDLEPEARDAPIRWVSRPRRILVVDDDVASRYVLAKTFPAHFRVHQVAGGRAGIAAAVAERPDVIFLDVVMPDLSGTDVFEALRADARTADIPVVFYTSLGSEAATDPRLARADALVPKTSRSKRQARAAFAAACIKSGLAEE